jgi:flagellar M-ring protein FliF
MAEAGMNQQPLVSGQATGMVANEFKPINPIDAIAQSHVIRHLARLVGLAAAVAIGMVVVLWSSEPNYAPLYNNLSAQDSSQIADVLMTNEIEFKLDPSSGAVMVDQAKLAEARLLVAGKGLPEGGTQGLEMLQDEQGLGTSQFIETARYHHALESELVRSVESIRSVESARVHLAIPKQSIFIRNRVKPSASVVVKLYSGRTLNKGQVEAVVQLVASSIPMMDATQVTVIDHFGRLLTQDEDEGIAQSNRQFEYTRHLEDSYVDRIINLLQPIVGEGKVNAQVAAQLDFSMVESTREAFDPERSVIRSEQISEAESRAFDQALGIPGALSNQPPGEGTTEELGGQTLADEIPANQNRSSTRNFEVDRVISHTSNPVGSIQRLSVAVVIDDKTITKDDGTVEKVPYDQQEIDQIANLVRETIGFDQNRGDSVSVISTSFLVVDTPVIEEIPMWKSLLTEPWIINLIKQVFGALGLLIVYLVFGRPFIRSLNPNRQEVNANEQQNIATATELDADGRPVPIGDPTTARLTGDIPNLNDDPNNPAALMRRKDATYDQKIEMARGLVMDDPARVANVMKQWSGDENG